MKIGAPLGWESREPTESWSSSRGTGSTPVPARNRRFLARRRDEIFQEDLVMASFKCSNCGFEKEGKCKPQKCPNCGEKKTFAKSEK